LPEFNEGSLTISAVTLPGTSLAESDQLGRALERVLLSVPEVVSTGRRTGRAELDEHVQGVESAEIDVDLRIRQRSKEKVLEEIRQKVTLLPGMNVSIGQPISHRINRILEGQFSFPLVVRYEGLQPGDPSAVEHTLIDTPSGAKIPLSAVAEAREDRGPNFIMREGVQRRIMVQCNVAGRDLRGVVNDIQKSVAASVNLPQGYRIEYGGQFESEAEASRRLLVLGLIVVAGILVILTSAFRSSKDALLIMLNLPLALVGGVVGVFFSGGVLS